MKVTDLTRALLWRYRYMRKCTPRRIAHVVILGKIVQIRDDAIHYPRQAAKQWLGKINAENTRG